MDEKIFPTRTGPSKGSATERQMLSGVGGPDGIRTSIRNNPDGSVTRLKTRGGMPEFITSQPKSEISGCVHGLYFGGKDYIDNDNAYKMRTKGGSLEMDSGAVVPLSGKYKPTGSDVYIVPDRKIMSGIYSRICGAELVEGSKAEVPLCFAWLARFPGHGLHLFKHEEGSSSLWIYSPTDTDMTSPVWQLSLPNLNQMVANWTPDSDFGTFRLELVDMDSTCRKLLFEIHKDLNFYGGAHLDVEHINRKRVLRAQTLLAAFESEIDYDGIQYSITNTTLITYPESVPNVAIVTPAGRESLPLPVKQSHSYNTAIPATGSQTTVDYYRLISYDPLQWEATPTVVPVSISANPDLQPDGSMTASTSSSLVINGLRYGVADALEVFFTVAGSGMTVEENGWISAANVNYYNGYNNLLTLVNYRRRYTDYASSTNYVNGSQIGEQAMSSRSVDKAYQVQGGFGSVDYMLVNTSGGISPATYSDDVCLLRLSNKVFLQVLSSGIPWGIDNNLYQNQVLAGEVRTGECFGTVKTKSTNSVVWSDSYTYSSLSSNLLNVALFSMNPLIYASERPHKNHNVAFSINKSLCWV